MNKGQFELMKSFINEYEKNYDKLNYNLERDFDNLRHYSNEIRQKKSMVEGERDCNRRKNRYKDILPFDDSRVILKGLQNGDNKEIVGSDYINASKVDGALEDSYKYIAAQGPTRDTVPDFVRMLRDYKIKILICACNEIEGDKLKCHRYWPESEQGPFSIYPNFTVKLRGKQSVYEGCIVRNLTITYPKSALDPSLNSDGMAELDFVQFHFTNWPDHGVPESCESIINILRLVRQDMLANSRGKRLNNEFLAVHCSAGCGRTGTIIAIDQLWTLMEENKLTSEFSMYKIASKLREQRVAMIQTFLQYQLFAKATYQLFVNKMIEISSLTTGYNSNKENLKIHSSNPSKSVAPLAPFSTAHLTNQPHSQVLDRIYATKKDVSPSAASHYDNEIKTSDKEAYLNSFNQPSTSIDTNNNNIYSSEHDPSSLCVSDRNDPNDSTSSSSSSSSTTSSPKSSSASKHTKQVKSKQKGLIKNILSLISPATHSQPTSSLSALSAPPLTVSNSSSLLPPSANTSPLSNSSNATSSSSVSISSKTPKYQQTTAFDSANHSLNDANSRSDEPDDDDTDIIVYPESSKFSKYKHKSSLTSRQIPYSGKNAEPSSSEFPSNFREQPKNSSAEDSSGQERTPRNNQVIRRKSRPEASDFVNRGGEIIDESNPKLNVHLSAHLAKVDGDNYAFNKTGSICDFANSKSSKSEQMTVRNQTTPHMNPMTMSQLSSHGFPPAKVYTMVNAPKSANSIQADVKSNSRSQKADNQEISKSDKPKLKELKDQISVDRSKLNLNKQDDASEENSDPPKPPSRPKNDRRKSSSYNLNNPNNPMITPVTTKPTSQVNDTDSDSLNSEDDEGQSKSSYQDSGNDNNELSNVKKFANIDRTSPSIFSNLDKQPTKSVALVDNNPNLHRSILSSENRKIQIVPNSKLYHNNKARANPTYEIKVNDESTNKTRNNQPDSDMVMSMTSECGPRKMSNENHDQIQAMTQSQTSANASSTQP